MEERNQEPTPRRLAEARAQGLVAQSPILVFAGAAGGVALVLGAGDLGELLAARLARGLALATTVGYAPGLAMESFGALAALIVPIVAAAAAGAALVGLAQTGFLFAPRALGWRRGGLRAGELGFRLVAGIAALALAALVIAGAARELPRAAGLGVPELLAAGGALVLALGPGALAAGALGLADWWRRRRRVHAELRMTRAEIDEERRETEGDPAFRHARRRVRRELLLAPLAGATLLVVDGERAVVLSGERAVERAEGFAARRIVEAARGQRVRIVYDPPLCAALYGGRVDRAVLARV